MGDNPPGIGQVVMARFLILSIPAAIVLIATVVAADDLQEQISETLETVVRIEGKLDEVQTDMDSISDDLDEIRRHLEKIDRKIGEDRKK